MCEVRTRTPERLHELRLAVPLLVYAGFFGLNDQVSSILHLLFCGLVSLWLGLALQNDPRASCGRKPESRRAGSKRLGFQIIPLEVVIFPGQAYKSRDFIYVES